MTMIDKKYSSDSDPDVPKDRIIDALRAGNKLNAGIATEMANLNKNFRSLFNSDVTLEGQNLLTLLGLLDVAQSYISEFKQKLNKDGKLLIHKIKIKVGDEER